MVFICQSWRQEEERNPGAGRGQKKEIPDKAKEGRKKSRSGQKKREENSGAVQQGKKTPRASWSRDSQSMKVSGDMAPQTLSLPGSDLMQTLLIVRSIDLHGGVFVVHVREAVTAQPRIIFEVVSCSLVVIHGLAALSTLVCHHQSGSHVETGYSNFHAIKADRIPAKRRRKRQGKPPVR